jgi:hypothetical protein
VADDKSWQPDRTIQDWEREVTETCPPASAGICMLEDRTHAGPEKSGDAGIQPDADERVDAAPQAAINRRTKTIGWQFGGNLRFANSVPGNQISPLNILAGLAQR